jgi:hypothetical protein
MKATDPTGVGTSMRDPCEEFFLNAVQAIEDRTVVLAKQLWE